MTDFHDILPESNNAFVSAARVILGLFVIAVGVVTFFVPEFKVAFISQLVQAGIPLNRYALFVIPMTEGLVGMMLVSGYLVRFASLVSILVMALLTYLGLVVPEPSVFPQQFGFPLMPILALVLSGFLYFVEGYDEED